MIITSAISFYPASYQPKDLFATNQIFILKRVGFFSLNVSPVITNIIVWQPPLSLYVIFVIG